MAFALGFSLTFWASVLALAEGRYVLAAVLFLLMQASAVSFFWSPGERS